jgi:hypothetical protein
VVLLKLSHVQFYVIVFICGLFNDNINSSDYIASNDRMISEKRIGEDTEGNGRCLLYANCLEGVRKTKKNCQNSLSPAEIRTRDLPNMKQECYIIHTPYYIPWIHKLVR